MRYTDLKPTAWLKQPRRNGNRGEQRAALQGPATSWGLEEERQKEQEQAKSKSQDGRVPRSQANRGFPEAGAQPQGDGESSFLLMTCRRLVSINCRLWREVGWRCYKYRSLQGHPHYRLTQGVWLWKAQDGVVNSRSWNNSELVFIFTCHDLLLSLGCKLAFAPFGSKARLIFFLCVLL